MIPVLCQQPRRSRRLLATIVLSILGMTSSAHAETFGNAYTSTAAKDCRKGASFKVGVDDYASDHFCKGIGGFVVLKREDDLRETVSIGRSVKDAAKQPAASQGFGPFNSTTDTIEWRLDPGGRPFAAIQRWHLADNDNPDRDGRPRTVQMLVVTRLPPGGVCHVAYVDVKANPNANEIARQAAEKAPAFNCGKDKVRVEGLGGRAIELAMPR